MIQKFDIKNFPKIEALHDSATSSIEFENNKLIFYFEHVCAETEADEKIKPHRKLKAIFVLSKEINYFESNDCSVKQINESKKLMNKAIKQLSLLEMVCLLKKQNGNLDFFAQYYNNGKCFIIAELIINNKKKWGNWIEINLLVDEIMNNSQINSLLTR